MNQTNGCKNTCRPAFFFLRRQLPFFPALILLACLVFSATACSPSSPEAPVVTPPNTDTTVTPPPATDTTVKGGQVADNPGPLHILQEVSISENPHRVAHTRNYNFYYDGQQRVSKVGIKYFSSLYYDTAVVSFYYNGDSRRPYEVISPNYTTGNSFTPCAYDTTWFWYDVGGRIVKDSCQCLLYGARTLLLRHYTYTSPHTFSIDLYRAAGDSVPLFRHDDVVFSSDSMLYSTDIKYYTWPYQIGEVSTNGILYSGYRNPLAAMNIGGLYYDWLEMPNTKEIFGNNWDKSLTDVNTIPYYMDFSSARIPTDFGLNAFYPEGFDIRITPLAAYPLYPQMISVGAATALDGRMEYTYVY